MGQERYCADYLPDPAPFPAWLTYVASTGGVRNVTPLLPPGGVPNSTPILPHGAGVRPHLLATTVMAVSNALPIFYTPRDSRCSLEHARTTHVTR